MATASEQRSVAEQARLVLARVAGGALLPPPVSLRFWDRSELASGQPASDEPASDGAASGEPASDGPASGGAPRRDLRIVVRDPLALVQIAREPNQLGLARAWALGELELEGDLDEVLELAERLPPLSLSRRDRLRIGRAIQRLAGRGTLRRPPRSTIETPARAGRRHSLSRDRGSVRHHYDVPTEFHRLVIGPSMVYSCAYFASPDDTLEQAQERKLELICRKLCLREGDRLLDIGCGWGSLLLHAVRHHGVRGVGVTLSEPQAQHARRRLAEAGPDIAARCEIRVADYREIDDGPFDAVASVGMYEHVGLAQLGVYVQTVERLLRPGGLFLNHGIARLWPPRRDVGGFTDSFIFPDGELHPVGELLHVLEPTGLEVRDLESMREHYGLTLRRWTANLAANRERAIELGGAERERIWRIYLTGSARAFEQGSLSIFQVLASRRGAPHRLPLSRSELIAGSQPRPWAGSARPQRRGADERGQRIDR